MTSTPDPTPEEQRIAVLDATVSRIMTAAYWRQYELMHQIVNQSKKENAA